MIIQKLLEVYGNTIDDTGAIANFYAADNSASLKFKQKITDVTGDKKKIEIMVPLKYLSNFWRSLEMSLINCEVIFNLVLYLTYFNLV